MINLKEKKGFLCDMDGVSDHGERLLPGVKEFVEWMVSNDKKFLFLTNARPAGPEPTQDSGPAFYVLDDEKNSFFSHFHLMEGRYTGNKRRDFYGKGIGPL